MITIIQTRVGGDVLTQLLKRLDNVQPALEAIGAKLESQVAGRFETRSDPEGKAWAPWSESYAAGREGQLLIDSTQMVNSLSWQADATSVLVGFGAVSSKKGDVYAVYHEFGTQNMPRRGLLTADPNAGTLAATDVAAIVDLLADFFG